MKRDVSFFFAGTDNTGLVFHDVELNDLEYAINNFYSDPFHYLRDDKGNQVIINLAKVEFIRVSGTHEA